MKSIAEYPAGLIYRSDYLNGTDQADVVSAIDAAPWINDLTRRVQHYGYRYDYKARRVKRGDYLGPLPNWLNTLGRRLARDGYFLHPPDQAIVNEYEPGQGIADHVDCLPCFGARIVSLSLLGSCEMRFLQIGGRGRHAIFLKPGSMLLLSGDARFRWKHGIPKRKSDLINGEKQLRTRRLSITFRNVHSV
ncbi:MAG: alpha-ketoglutarate-dependent dioxygenase AlkB [Pseudomonadota bacterium]